MSKALNIRKEWTEKGDRDTPTWITQYCFYVSPPPMHSTWTVLSTAWLECPGWESQNSAFSVWKNIWGYKVCGWTPGMSWPWSVFSAQGDALWTPAAYGWRKKRTGNEVISKLLAHSLYSVLKVKKTETKNKKSNSRNISSMESMHDDVMCTWIVWPMEE